MTDLPYPHYLVGGAVRDQLLGEPVKDRDWVITGATPEALKRLGFRQVGADFPVFLHPDTAEEYALARTERKSGQGYHGFVCDFSPDTTLEQDLARRDLTINAMALTPEGDLVDPYGGADDLKNRWLRHVSPAFSEDPLRVVRVARFAARLQPWGFRVHPDTLALMERMAAQGDLAELTPQRIWQDVEKALLTDRPDVFVDVLDAIGGLPDLLPPLASVMAGDAEPAENWLTSLVRAARLTDRLDVRWSVFCHRADTPEALSDHLQVSRALARQARLTDKWWESLARPAEVSADHVLGALNESRAWQHPDRFTGIVLAVAAITGLPETDYRPLLDACDAARQVDTRPILEAGFKGPDVGRELDRRRLDAISGCLS